MEFPSGFSRRGFVGSAMPAIALGAAIPIDSSAKATSKSVAFVDAAAFGAKGDGETDDYTAIMAALETARVVTLAPGRFRIRSPIRLRDGQALRGSGSGGWEPYIGHGAPAALGRTTIVVDSGVAIDARDSANVELSGLAIAARDARQSAWANPPGFQKGAVGIDIVGSLQFRAIDVSFHGLEVAVSALANKGRTAQMPSLDQWSAHDCGTVFQLISKSSNFAPVRDARISGCIGAVHCKTVVDASNCDGLRIENCRFFQCSGNAVRARNTPFITIIGTTMFETTEATLELRECSGVTMAGVQLVRAGFYHSSPAVQREAVILDRCQDVSFEGLIERPIGRAFTITDSRNVSIGGAIANPFWSTGSLGSNDAAICIENSSSISLNSAFSGGDYWIAVMVDAQSARTTRGQIATEESAGVIRCHSVQAAPLGHFTRLTASTPIIAGRTAIIDTIRIFVPPLSNLVSRSVSVTFDGVVVQADTLRWSSQTTEPSGGSLSLERQVLHTNSQHQGHYASVPIGLHNPSTRDIAVPPGTEVGLSLAIEPVAAR